MSIEVTTLDNGLTVATDRIDTVESVSLGMWVGVGARHEAQEINGVAHLLEHMAFKGTSRRNARQIAEEIEAVGGHLNAYTSRESTAYYARALREDSGLALDLIADILQHSTLDEEELARERQVVLQEIGQANDTPDDIIFDHFQETAYPGQALGRPVLGSSEIVARLDRGDLAGFLDDEYGAERMVLAAAGNIDHARLVDEAAEAFAGLRSRPRAPHGDGQYAGGEYREARDLEQLHLVLGFEGVSYHDPDYYASSVLSTLLGGGMSSRLFQEIREKRGLVYSVHSFAAYFNDGGLFGIYAGTGETEAEELTPVLCEEIVRTADTLTDIEVERARAQLKASLMMGLESTMARCEQLGNQLLVHGRPIPVDEIKTKLAEVDREAVARVARRIFSTRPTLAALGQVRKLDSYDGFLKRLG